MSSVPDGRRSQSDFQAEHDMMALRDVVTAFVRNKFGFDENKYRADIEKYRAAHAKDEKVDEIVARYEMKYDFFVKTFVPREYERVLDLITEMDLAFTMGNSIFPSDTPARFFECLQRRYYMNVAVAKGYALKREINYVLRVLPVDRNKYSKWEKRIRHVIVLIKGVRQADNRFFKVKGKKKTVDITNDISHISESIIAIINKVRGNS